jgi:acetate kinase
LLILVINSGSSSIKASLYDIGGSADVAASAPLWQANVDLKEHKVEFQSKGETHKESALNQDDEENIFAFLLNSLWHGEYSVVSSQTEIKAVGHRIVHGGPKYSSSVLIDDEVKEHIRQCAEFAPLHNPANLHGIEAVEKELPGVPQVAVFDTAFHHNLPAASATYAIPFEFSERYKIRRYGFHGISHQYCSTRAAQLLNRRTSGFRVIVAHLGNGCSMSAVRDGASIDTTMGFTPLDGLVMGTRSGAVDPGILLYLLTKEAHTHDELEEVLEHKSGLRGISGTTSDMREILEARDKGDKRAQLAFDVFVHSLTGYTGSMLAQLDGADAIVFTGGIGEHVPELRSAVCKQLSFAGVALDDQLNQNWKTDSDVSISSSKIRVLVIHTQENWTIAKETHQVVSTGVVR